MDIAHRLGLGGTPKISKLAEFAVALVGLSDNPTHGPCAQRGVPLRAEPSGPVPAGVSYQWHVAGEGPITGATEASFVPDAPLAAESAIFCVVSAPGQGSSASAPVIFRDAAPQLGTTLFDEVFDLDTGPQIVEVAAGFTGLNLRFAVSGAGAEIDPVTGDVAVPTDMERDGDVVVVTAANSGGAASAAFQVTIEDVAVEGALPFGALTPAGAGGVPVNGAAIASGDPKGHWQIAGGMLVPSRAGEGALSGFYPLVLDSGDRVDVMIEDDKASARPDEIAAVFARLPLTARGLMVQDGDARPLGRIRLEPRVFEREMVLEPVNWLEDPDPRQSLRPVTLAGLTIGGDPSGDKILRMENLTVQGFVCQMETGPGETEGNNGIILVERPSRHVVIRQNEIWSRDTREIIEANDFRDNLNTSRQMRGIATKVYSGTNEYIRIEENHIHDVSRGVIMTATSSYQGVRSRLCNNIIEDCYTNFFTCGYLDGLDIFDNRCMHISASLNDTLGAIPKTSPHASTGGSFDTDGSRSTQNITMMGNLLHVGWRRTKIHEELGLPNIKTAATGVKFNDPKASDSYWNLVVAFNTIVSHGISLEISGAGADNHILVFNNTMAGEDYVSTTSGPQYYLAGAVNVRHFNNIGPLYKIGAADNVGFLALTSDTLSGYGNVTIGPPAFGRSDYFIGDPVKGLDLLTIDEALTAYTAKATTYAMLSANKKGAQGTGLYAGNGVHSANLDIPKPVGGVTDVAPLTIWDGSSHLVRPAQLVGSEGHLFKSFLFAWEGEFAPLSGRDSYLMSFPNLYLYIRRYSGSGRLEIFAKHVTTGAFLKAVTSIGLLESDGLVRFAISYDMDTARLQFMKNGVMDPFVDFRLLDTAERMHFGGTDFRINAGDYGADSFKGNFGRAYFNPQYPFFDLGTDVGMSALFAADGSFRDWGSDGSLVTGETPLVYIRGNATTIGNLGSGGPFLLVGDPLTE